MTISATQLDDLERNARGELADDDQCVPIDADVTLQLVTVYRAALAYSQACAKENEAATQRDSRKANMAMFAASDALRAAVDGES